MRQCRLRAIFLLASLVWCNLGTAQGQSAPSHSRLANPGPAVTNPLDRLKNLQMFRELDAKQIEILKKVLGKSSLESVNFDEVWEKLDSVLHEGAPGAAKNRAFEQHLESMTGQTEEKQAPSFLNDVRDFAKRLLPSELSASKKRAQARTLDGPALQPSAPAPRHRWQER